MTTTRRPWTTAQLVPLAVCPDLETPTSRWTGAELDLFTAVVRHDDSCPWSQRIVRGSRRPDPAASFAFAAPTSDVILDLATAPRVAF